MGIFHRNKRNTNYVHMDVTGLLDERLSWKAKGILAYLLSKPDDWKTYITELMKHAKDGRDSTTAGIDELIKYQYIIRKGIREKGRYNGYEYLVGDVPFTDEEVAKHFTVTDFPTSVSPTSENLELVLNTNTNKEKSFSLGTDEESEILDSNHFSLQPLNNFPYVNCLPQAQKAINTYYSWEGKIDELKKEVGYDFDLEFLNEQKKSFIEKLPNYSQRMARTFGQLKAHFVTWVRLGWERKQKEKSYAKVEIFDQGTTAIAEDIIEKEKLLVIDTIMSKEKISQREKIACGVLAKKSASEITSNLMPIMEAMARHTQGLSAYKQLTSRDLIYIELNYPSAVAKIKIIEALRAVVKYRPKVETLIEAIKIQLS